MIPRFLLHIGALTAGAVMGAALVLATAPAPAVELGRPDPTAPTPPPIEAKPAPLPTPNGGILLAWTPGRLPPRLSEASAIDGVNAATTVHAGPLELVSSNDASGQTLDELAPGWVIPIDAIAVEPATFAGFAAAADRRLIERLQPGQTLLGATSAALRRAEVGTTLHFDAGSSTSRIVVGIVDDATIGGAELALHRDDDLATGFDPRYVLVRHEGDRSAVDAALRATAGGTPARVRAPGETPFLRHGDAVLPQSLVKARYGEFAYRRRPPGSSTFEPDPAWVAENIETRPLPILGRVTCHRAVLDPLGSALADLDRRGLAHTIDVGSFEGCWNPRFVSDRRELSRHAWGIAVDLNASGNPTGSGSGQPPELVEVLTARGWGWGGTWLVPDPMHFELVDPVVAEPIKVLP